MLVPAEIWTVARSEQGSAVLVRPMGSDLAVPIIIGQSEAQSIMIGLSNQYMPRPLTHDLILSVLKNFNATVNRVEITDLRNSTFYGRLILNQSGKEYSIDSRPSDCLALAVRVKCPVYIDELVVDEAGVSVNIIDENVKTKEDKKHDEILKLKKKLENAIQEEDYEEAATLRDKINELEKTE